MSGSRKTGSFSVRFSRTRKFPRSLGKKGAGKCPTSLGIGVNYRPGENKLTLVVASLQGSRNNTAVTRSNYRESTIIPRPSGSIRTLNHDAAIFQPMEKRVRVSSGIDDLFFTDLFRITRIIKINYIKLQGSLMLHDKLRIESVSTVP